MPKKEKTYTMQRPISSPGITIDLTPAESAFLKSQYNEDRGYALVDMRREEGGKHTTAFTLKGDMWVEVDGWQWWRDPNDP